MVGAYTCAHMGGAHVPVPGSDPCPHTVFETQPDLWAEAESLLEPWANLTLTCRACLVTTDFQLFKDGVLQELVHTDVGAKEQRFPLGAVTSDNRGLYRCRYAMGSRWTQLSNLLEVTGAGEQLGVKGDCCWRGLLSSTPHSPCPPLLPPPPEWLGDFGHVT